MRGLIRRLPLWELKGQQKIILKKNKDAEAKKQKIASIRIP